MKDLFLITQFNINAKIRVKWLKIRPAGKQAKSKRSKVMQILRGGVLTDAFSVIVLEDMKPLCQ